MTGLFLLKMLHFRIRDYIAVSSKELAGKFSEPAGWVPKGCNTVSYRARFMCALSNQVPPSQYTCVGPRISRYLLRHDFRAR